MWTFLFLIKILAKSWISFFVYPAPVGFEGELKITHFVFFVMAFFNFFAVSLNPSCSVHLTIFGFPPANKTMSGYDTQKGAGIITSSPLFKVAMNVL